MNTDPILYKYNTLVANFQIAQNMAMTALQNKNMKQAEFYNNKAQKYLQMANYYLNLIMSSNNQVEVEFGKKTKRKVIKK